MPASIFGKPKPHQWPATTYNYYPPQPTSGDPLNLSIGGKRYHKGLEGTRFGVRD